MDRISVFLDDYRAAPEGYVLVETIDECIKLLESFPVEHLSLDHDLLSPTRNGTKLVEIMLKEQLFANRITIHSANAPLGKAMYKSLKKAQDNLIMSKDVILSLRPLPLHFIPPEMMQHYLEIR